MCSRLLYCSTILLLRTVVVPFLYGTGSLLLYRILVGLCILYVPKILLPSFFCSLAFCLLQNRNQSKGQRTLPAVVVVHNISCFDFLYRTYGYCLSLTPLL